LDRTQPRESDETRQTGLEAKLAAIVGPALEGMGYELVRVAVLGRDRPTMPGTWSLEVSSAGIDRPLTRAKDWNRFAGHLARAETLVPINGRRRFSGIVLGANDDAAQLRLDDGNEIVLPLRDIRRAKLVLTDALIAATATPKPTN
jgi:ribosome maturation factor RimP